MMVQSYDTQTLQTDIREDGLIQDWNLDSARDAADTAVRIAIEMMLRDILVPVGDSRDPAITYWLVPVEPSHRLDVVHDHITVMDYPTIEGRN